MVLLIFGIIWIIKGEIKIRKSPWWNERRISASNGRTLGTMMVFGSLIPLCISFPEGIGVVFSLLIAIFPIIIGIAVSEELPQL